jgi:hypothetical protein
VGSEFVRLSPAGRGSHGQNAVAAFVANANRIA